MASSLCCGCFRSPRFVPLTKLDIALALGKVQLPGDAGADAEEASLYDLGFDDPNLDGYDGWDVQNDDWIDDWPYESELLGGPWTERPVDSVEDPWGFDE